MTAAMAEFLTRANALCLFATTATFRDHRRAASYGGCKRFVKIFAFHH
jgi:hypothetical protein